MPDTIIDLTGDDEASGGSEAVPAAERQVQTGQPTPPATTGSSIARLLTHSSAQLASSTAALLRGALATVTHARAAVGPPARGGSTSSAPRSPASRPGQKRDRPTWVPPDRRVPGTDFLVDAFRFGGKTPCTHWVLTHFHSDHYGGLDRTWCHGKIYASQVTASLAAQRLGVPPQWLVPLPMSRPILIAGVKVTLLDANHCPGSALWLFELASGASYLHTGDMRWHPRMSKYPALRPFTQPGGTQSLAGLYLDTTYCDAKYAFPTQAAVVAAAVSVAKSFAADPGVLFVVGSYGIGKERVFMAIAEALDERVVVNATKLRMLQSLGWPLRDVRRLTTDTSAGRIFVVPMHALSAANLDKWLSRARGGDLSFGGYGAGRPAAASASAAAPSLVSGRGRGGARSGGRVTGVGRFKTSGRAASSAASLNAAATAAAAGAAPTLGQATLGCSTAGRLHVARQAPAGPARRIHSIVAFKPTGWTFQADDTPQAQPGGAAHVERRGLQSVQLAIGNTAARVRATIVQRRGGAKCHASAGGEHWKLPGSGGCSAADDRTVATQADDARTVATAMDIPATQSTVALPEPEPATDGQITLTQVVPWRGDLPDLLRATQVEAAPLQAPSQEDPSVAAQAASMRKFLSQASCPDPSTEVLSDDSGTVATEAMDMSSRAATASSTSARLQPGGVTLLGLPYSEHSSFSELRHCVGTVRTRSITPTVGGRSQEARAAMVALLTTPAVPP